MVELNEKALEAAHRAYETHGQMGDLKTRRLSDSCLTAVITAYLAALPEEVVFCPNCGWNSAMDGPALPAPDDGLVERLTVAADGVEKVSFDRRSFRRGYENILREAATALQSKDEKIERLTRERDEAQERATANGMSWANALNECEEAEQQAQKLTKENLELMASHNENAKLRGQRDAALALVATFTAENERLRKALLAIATVGLAASDAAYVAAVALETQEGGK